MQNFAVVVVALVSAGPAQALSRARGSIKLDNYTLDKMLTFPGINLLVKFDKMYVKHDEREDEYKDLCMVAYEVPDFFIGEVPVQQFGDVAHAPGENDDLRERYGLKFSDFPYYRLFNEKNKDGLGYPGEVKAEDIRKWLRKNQVILPAIKTIRELDQIAHKFLHEGLPDARIEEAKKLAIEVYSKDPKAKMYVLTMKSIKEKGSENPVAFVEAEIKEVEKNLEDCRNKASCTAKKAAKMENRLKVMRVFDEAHPKNDEL